MSFLGSRALTSMPSSFAKVQNGPVFVIVKSELFFALDEFTLVVDLEGLYELNNMGFSVDVVDQEVL